MRTAVIYEGPSSTPVEGDEVVVVGVPVEDVVDEARRLVAAGADRVELCGGLGPVPVAEVQAAVGDGVPVGGVMFGFESLEGAVAFKQRYAAGEDLHAAFLYRDPTAGPQGRRTEAGGDVFVGVADGRSLVRVAAELEAGSIALFELYGGLGPADVAEVLGATGGRVPVGLALYPRP